MLSTPSRVAVRRLIQTLAVSTAMIAPSMAVAKSEPKAAEPAALVKAVDIPFEQFTLDNGLRVVVHTDRKAPVVATSVWYRVGSKHEPAGKTGFAHLFEHLMFNGSENAPGDFFEPTKEIGATDQNGTTNADRTNYFQTVPTGALERILFLESDRMGHLLGAVTQEKLDNQRGVVQNEKRQGDNNPYGLLRYDVMEHLFPKGSPYHHSTIGSMADLNSASLEDVKNWFRDNYGPNNAVLVLAGDIDAKTAKPLVQKWFGHIPRGPEVKTIKAAPVALPAPLAITRKDMIPSTTIFRLWSVPGSVSKESVPLQMGMSVLGGLSSSRLDNALVRKDPVMVSVGTGVWNFEDAGALMVQAVIKPGVDVAEATKKLDDEIAAFLKSGPTADELKRVQTVSATGVISGLESVGGFGGKAVALAEGALFANDPALYKRRLNQMVTTTPEQVHALLNEWMSRPALTITYEPGPRTEGGEHRGGAVTSIDTAVAAKALPAAPLDWYRNPAHADGAAGMVTTAAPVDSYAGREAPPVAQLTALDFPTIERATLKNGIKVYFARRAAVPMVRVALSFDAGMAADPKSAPGTQRLMLSVMDEGTTTRDSIALAEAKERLGASIWTGSDMDDTDIGLLVPTANLAAGLNLLSDFTRNPAFDPKEVNRVRDQQLTGIKAELNNPNALAGRTLMPILYGKDHPYGVSSALGEPASVAKLAADDLRAFHSAWIRPDNATIFVVGDTTLKAVTKQLNRTFGQWKAPASAKAAKAFTTPVPNQTSRIVLVDRPNAPQSVILAGRVLDAKGATGLEPLRAANEIFGGDFLSRINMNLRETKGWSYGVRSRMGSRNDRLAFTISAPVQADRTGDAIKELRSDLTAFVTTKGVTDAEVARTVNGNIRELPGSFETADSVLDAMQMIVGYGWPDDYYEKLADTYRAMTPATIDAAARKEFRADDLVYVVVGDAAKVKPQLDALGLPVETVAPAGK